MNTNQIIWKILQRYPRRWVRPVELLRLAQAAGLVSQDPVVFDIASKTFSAALRALAEQGVVERWDLHRHKPRYRYLRGSKFPADSRRGAVPAYMIPTCERCGEERAVDRFRGDWLCRDCLIGPDDYDTTADAVLGYASSLAWF